jgi:hypothetical protein
MSEDKLDKILSDLHGYELPLTGEVTLDADLDYGNKIVAKEKAQAKQAIQDYIRSEIIGEDETDKDEVTNDLFYATRNGLRRQQRRKLGDV